MANITNKRTGQIIRKIFEVLIAHPDGLNGSEVLKLTGDSLGMTDFEKSDYPNHPGVRRFEHIARFATIAAVKAGWMVKDSGLWTVTDPGKTAFEKYKDPEQFKREAGKLYDVWKASQDDGAEDGEEQTEQSVTVAYELAEEAAAAEIESYLKRMPPYDFQELVAALLRGMGYTVSHVAPPGPDGGIDIFAHEDPLGIGGRKIKVQVKRQEKKVDVDGLRAFMALVGANDAGIFVSTGGFSADAQKEARFQDRRISLVDLKRFVELWIDHYSKIPQEGKQLLTLKAVFYLAPGD